MALIVGSICRNIARSLHRSAGRCSVVVAATVAIAIIAMVPTRAHAQLIPAAIYSADESPTAPKAFAVRKADSKIVDLLEDFQRYSGKRSWELAFHALNSIDEAGNVGSVPAGDGFMVPVQTRVQQLLLALPPEGRDAYRLFNDANARQLWQHVQDTRAGLPADELTTLHKLVDRYFLTSVGDLAADRLGDALFEQGNFAGAERAWRLVAEKYADAHLSLAKLQAKRCVAFSLLGRRDALVALAAQIREKYADQTITFGGRETNAADFADSLVAKLRPHPRKRSPCRHRQLT